MSITSYASDILQNEEYLPQTSEQKLKANQDIILYKYSSDEISSVVFSMDMFNECFSREEIKDIIIQNKKACAPATYEYRKYTVSDEEVDELYSKIEQMARRAPSSNSNFSNIYWQIRDNMVTLTLIPTDIIKNDLDQNYRDVPWVLVKRMCEKSQYWTNEASISKQYDCHYLGEVLARRGIGPVVGNWDIEPARPAYNAFTYAINQCNP